MGIGHMFLRIIVLILSLPFAYIAALVPCSFLKVAVENMGIPSWIVIYPVGAIIMICFCGYFQEAITLPENPDEYKSSNKPYLRGRFNPAGFIANRFGKR